MENSSTQKPALASKICFGLLIVSLLLVLLDQWTKILIVESFVYGEKRAITSYFDLYYLRNFGAAFSFLNDAGGWQKGFFITLSGVVSLGIIIWLFRFARSDQKLLATAMSLVLAGAFGNMIDRIQYGYVVDFISFHFEALGEIPVIEYLFPNGRFAAFNVADMAISCGAILLIIDWYYEAKHEKAERLLNSKKETSTTEPSTTELSTTELSTTESTSTEIN